MPKNKAQKSTNFCPDKRQIYFLQTYLLSKVDETIESICILADVPRRTYYNWREKPEFVEWFNGEVIKALHADLPQIWKRIKSKCKNDIQACKLFLQRFDDEFAEKRAVEHTGSIETIATVKLKPLKKKCDNCKKGDKND